MYYTLYINIMSNNVLLKRDLFSLLSSNPSFIRDLIKYNLNIPLDILDTNNNTILNRLIINGETESAKLLLKNISECDESVLNFLINTQNSDGNTSLHTAVQIEDYELASMIYKMGADVSIVNNENYAVEPSVFNQTPSLKHFIKRVIIPIPDMLPTITSTDVNDNRNNKLSEFEFLQNFLEKRPQGMNRMQGMQGMQDMQDMQGMQGMNRMQGMQDMQGMQGMQGMQDMQGMQGMQGMSQRNMQSNLSNLDSINTDEFLRFIKQNKIQLGGANNTVSGVRKINNKLSETSSTADTLNIGDLLKIHQEGGRKKKKSFKLKHALAKPSRSVSRSLSRPSNDLHQEVIDILKKNYSLSEDDARYIKAGLYYNIKDKFANLSNMQKALKLKELAMDSNEVNKMKKDLPRLKETVEKARKQRQDEKTNSPSPKFNKDKVKKEVKEVKEVKKDKEVKKKSKRSKRS